MRFKLWRRRLTISAPRVSVRSAMPWPLRWAMVAIVLGFCAAIGLWAFELGKDLAGVDGSRAEELAQVRTEVQALQRQLATLKDERDKAQTIANTSATLLTAEKAVQERLLQQNRQLDTENQGLKESLAFFEKLIPRSAAETLSIRGLQADAGNGRTLKWQLLVILPVKNAPEFKGRIELVFAGTLAGKPWEAALPEGPLPLQFKQYGRVDGVFELPPQVVLKSVTARVLDTSGVRATQTLKL
jgi:hypothetical protein